jgi:hypothetical protein
MPKGNEGLIMRNESMWIAYLIFENTPLVRWFHINANSTSKSFQTNSWFCQPNSLKCVTNFMIIFNRFHKWLNLISWIANFSNFMNLLNQFHYMNGPCSGNFAQNLFLAFQHWMTMAHCFHKYNCIDDALHLKIIHSIFNDSLSYVDTSRYYGYPYETIRKNSITFEKSSQSMPYLEVVFII